MSRDSLINDPAVQKVDRACADQTRSLDIITTASTVIPMVAQASSSRATRQACKPG